MRPHGSTEELERLRRRGVALLRKPHPRRKPKLSTGQRKQFLGLLKRGPRANGYTMELWTLRRIAEVIHRHFAVHYDLSHVWRMLTAMGWSAQKPERRARERDEIAIARWRGERWPRIKKTRRGGRGAG